MGADLYKHLQQYFIGHLKQVREVRGERVLIAVLSVELSDSELIPNACALASHTQEASDLTDEPLLRYYTREWDRYTTGASYVNRLFTYLNRHWVKREKDEGRKNVYIVYIVRPPVSSRSGWLSPRADHWKPRPLGTARARLVEGVLLLAPPERRQQQAHVGGPQADREAAERRDDRDGFGQEGDRLVW